MTKHQIKLYENYHSSSIKEEKFSIARKIIKSIAKTPIPIYCQDKSLGTLKGEKWEKINIDGFNDFFEVSNYGRLKRLFRYVGYRNGNPKNWYEKIISPGKGGEANRGRLQTQLRVNNIIKHIQPHQYVMATFSKDKNTHNCINHIDGNPLNNHILNLEYCSYSYNEEHSYKVLGKKPVNGFKPMDIRLLKGMVGQYSLSGKLIKKFNSRKETKGYGFCPAHVSAVISGVRKSHANSLWKEIK